MSVITTFQDLVAEVPDIVQPLIVAAAGAVPFVEGEGAATIGIIGGVNPVIAVLAAIVGNFACVALVVLLSSGARQAVVNRTRVPAMAGGAPERPAVSPRKAKFQRAFERYGVPGVSLLGPLLLPTQFTASMLAAAGVGRGRILVWQGIAIVAWTTIIAVIISGVLSTVG
ncbi:small multidrug efflux protein [Rathayibacter sp. VKM Ac-2803]|uniref:small multidrug efflux protein n=1 Tax=unclassified Rathayibacter TaxID=2609250 RepID=UPI00135B2B05|nr:MULTISPECIES: small multidrug efflux protein [unclassified Rathayibacter]MWV51216.1 small multidrug efflux protein [Rathayibacter sp. VKM Ac-2803]MWV57700.1 small multidrug efflux protein [Rathayibacter sp. VKM Ac-2754]